MDNDELRAALARNDWSQRGFARELRVDERTVRKWVSGESPVPGYVISYIEAHERRSA